MKVCVLVFFLVLGISSLAQTTAPQAAPPSTFFVKGQEWQYVNFVAKKGLFGKRNGYIESTRFSYKVIGVTDSNGVVYSTILKTGTAVNDNYSWHRNFVVRGNQGVLSLPADYYLIDTVFLCDVYGNWPKPAVYSDLHATGDSLQYPLGADTSSQLKPSGYVMDINLFDPQRAEGMKSVGFVGTSRNIHYKGISVTITRRFVGTTRITTEAGIFDCYQYHVEADMESGPVRKQVFEEYYNPAVGIVKTEDTRGTYMELVRVKKKK